MDRSILLFISLIAIVISALPLTALAQGGLAGNNCNTDSECMSRTCGSDGSCIATLCKFEPGEGGIGPEMPRNYCNPSQFYNPDRVCTFGFGKCTKAECCDTLSCDAGVGDIAKGTYCPPGTTFPSARLCPGGVCTPNDCCIVTQCDSAAGVSVARRATFCSTGMAFNNAGLCAAGQGLCTSDECCELDTRTCAVAAADPKLQPTCPWPSLLVKSRIYKGNVENGGCCETKTCATNVGDGDKGDFCSGMSNAVFVGSPPCASGTCTTSDCCASVKGYCDGDGLKQSDGTCACAASDKTYVVGFGCACSAGTQLIGTGCKPCPYGSYQGTSTSDQKCVACPSNQPYTASTGSTSANDCVNYCDQQLLYGANACTNGGVCASLSGNPSSGGSFSCTCPPNWMGYGATTSNNCDAPTTLLRLRVLAANGVSLPSGLKLQVTHATKLAADPAYVLQAPSSLSCTLSGCPTTPTVPTCTTGGTGALSAALVAGNANDTRKFVGTKVTLSTNVEEIVMSDPLVTEWACSDGVSTILPEFSVVLPGPANPNGAQTLVCTAIVSFPAMTTLIQLQLGERSLIPAAAAGSTGPGLLTFAQGTRPACTLAMPSKVKSEAAAPECASNDQPFEGGKPGVLGVGNVDMERYTVAWTCAAKDMETDDDGNAATPNLPTPGQQAILVCSATFQLKKPQLTFTFSSEAKDEVTLTAMQPGMNEPCTLTIPGTGSGISKAEDAAALLSCPVSNLNSGVLTTLATDADLTKYLVSYKCKTSGNEKDIVVAVQTALVETTRNGAEIASSCHVTITALPPLLTLMIDNAAKAKAFKAFASQDSSDTCVVESNGNPVSCFLADGMMPSILTTLSPRALDANKYTLKWDCTGATAAFNAFNQPPLSNSATVMLNANANAGVGVGPVSCVGTVGDRKSPVQVLFDVWTSSSADWNATAQVPLSAEIRVRQSHQSKACSAQRSALAAPPIYPACDNEGLNALVGTKTTFSTANVDLSKSKVAWSCASDSSVAVPTTLVAAGVITAEMQGPERTVVCKAFISEKPPVLTLSTAGGAGPASGWTLSARQTSQGKACTRDVAATNSTPLCILASQPLLPLRSTVLSTMGLDVSRWGVAWSCLRFDGKTAVTLSDTISSAGAIVANSKSVTLDRDANAGGGTVACTATVTPRSDLLLLKATGTLPDNYAGSWSLTAKQATQTKACVVDAKAAAAGAAPVCDAIVLGFVAGSVVELGVTGLPASSLVTWECASSSDEALSVFNGNGGMASFTLPVAAAGVVTACTANVQAQTTPFFQIAADKGLTFSAFQGGASSDKEQGPMCTVQTQNELDDKEQPQQQVVVCESAAPRTITALVAKLDEGMKEDTIVRFTCRLGVSGALMPVSKKSAFSAVVLSPPAVETILCKATVLARPPVLIVTSNRATVITVRTEKDTSVCTSTTATNKLACDAGDGKGQLEAGTRVQLSQEGLEDEGFYRWSCSSTEAKIVRLGEMTNPKESTATIQLPPEDGDGKSLACSLTWTKDEPVMLLGLRRLAMLM